MENQMSLKLGTNFAVFLLFFVVAALDAFQSKNMYSTTFWLVVGAVFLFGDNAEKRVRAD